MSVKIFVVTMGSLLACLVAPLHGEQPVEITPAVPLIDWPFDLNAPLHGLDPVISAASDNIRLAKDASDAGHLVEGVNGTALRLNSPEGYCLRRAGNKAWIKPDEGFSLMFRIRTDTYPLSKTTKGPQILTLEKDNRPWITFQYRWKTPSEAEKKSLEQARIALWFRPGDNDEGVLFQSDLIKTREWIHVALTYNPSDRRAPLRWYLNGTDLYNYDKTINIPSLETLRIAPADLSTCYLQGALDDFRLYSQTLYSGHITQLSGQIPDDCFRNMRHFSPDISIKALTQLEDAERHFRFELQYGDSVIANVYAELNASPIILNRDGNETPDLFATSTGGAWFYKRVGPELFKPPELFEPAYNGSSHDSAHAASPAGRIQGVFDRAKWYPDFLNSGFSSPCIIPGLDTDKNASLYFADYDGDGKDDVVAMQNGGCVWFRNTGANKKRSLTTGITAKTVAGTPLKISSGAIPFDWDSDGDQDLLYQQNQGELMVYENVAPKNAFPVYRDVPAPLVTEDDLPYDHFSTSVRPAVADWDGDGDNDIIITAQGGDFLWLENLGQRTASGKPAWRKRGFFKQTGGGVSYGALATPSVGDLDGDGDEDIVCGNSDGFLGWFENITPPGAHTTQWSAVHPILSEGRPYRFMAGETLSIQGAGERKYGYTVPTVVDWDMDGLPDILLNTIAGKALWLRNEGTKNRPAFGPASPIEVAWEGPPEKSPWNTFVPGPHELSVQWRTSLSAVDWNHDGLTDLVIVDSEGYLAWLQRKRIEGKLILLPPKRVFENTDCTFVYDYANYREFKDVNHDGWNDFRMRDSKGALVYHFRDTAAKLGRDSQGRRYNFTVTVNTADMKDPDNRNLKPLSPGTINAYRKLTDDENRLLRLTAGWAGQSGRRKFNFVDWDGDGDLDLLVNQYPYGASLFENVKQTGERAVFTDRGPLFDIRMGGHSTCPTQADFNHDGIPDLLMGNQDGELILIERKSFQDLPGRGAGWL